MKPSKKRKRVNLLNESSALLSRAYRDYALSQGIGLSDLQLFYQIFLSTETLTQKQICGILSVSKTTLNSVIKRWTEKNYIVLLTKPGNKREKEVVLTEDGRLFAEDLILPLLAAEEKAATSFEDNELKAAHKTMAKYARKLRRIIVPEDLPEE